MMPCRRAQPSSTASGTTPRRSIGPLGRQEALIQNFDSFAPFEILKTWGPLLLFVVVWLYSMRRYSTQYRQPWDQILRRLEGIENHLARIATLLEERRGK